MLLVPTYIAPSSIAGVGLHAKEFIPAGTVVWRFHPRFSLKFSSADLKEFPKQTVDIILSYTYDHPEFPDHLMLDIDNARFENHSDNANTRMSGANEAIAVRDIRAGEEITGNYYEFYRDFTGDFSMTSRYARFASSNNNDISKKSEIHAAT